MTQPVPLPRLWLVLPLLAILLAVAAVVFDVEFAERWISPDGEITPDSQDYLFLLRGGLAVGALLCLGLWFVRRPLNRDMRRSLARWRDLPVPPAPSAVVPRLRPPILSKAALGFLLLWAVGVVFALLPAFNPVVADLVRENGVFETLTVVAYLATGGIFVWFAIRRWREHRAPGLRPWILLLLGTGCLLIVAEETNWGEVYLHYESGDFIRRINHQKQVSLHNLPLPYLPTYWINDLARLMALFAGAFIPLAIWGSRFVRRGLTALGAPVPPWTSLVYFLAAAIIPSDTDFDLYLRLERANTASELREVTFAMGVALWGWCLWQDPDAPPSATGSSVSPVASARDKDR